MKPSGPRSYSVARDVLAGCFVCGGSDYLWHGPHAQGVAARHHDATGHRTWADVTMHVLYGDDRDEATRARKVARRKGEK